MEAISTAIVRHLSLILGTSLLAFSISLIAAPFFIKALKRFQFGQSIRETTVDGKEATIFNQLHKKKEGTPSMGGVLIWLTVVITSIISLAFPVAEFTNFSLINRAETYLPMFTLITCGVLGLVDDVFNVKKIGSHKGLRAVTKMTWLTLLALLGGLWFHFRLGYTEINLGILGGNLEIGWLYIPLFIFVIISSANAVNITDGLDGLAGGLVILAFTVLGIVAYTEGLTILAAFCATIVGASVGFLWFNVPPAAFFMGDTGSLALGATIGVIAMMIDHILLIPFITFIFIIETLSVIIQLLSKKFRGKKVFHIAPIHHHFEYIGWPEFRVTMRFWILGCGFASLGLIFYLAKLI